jgi:hypothetical protein
MIEMDATPSMIEMLSDYDDGFEDDEAVSQKPGKDGKKSIKQMATEKKNGIENDNFLNEGVNQKKQASSKVD